MLVGVVVSSLAVLGGEPGRVLKEKGGQLAAPLFFCFFVEVFVT